MMHSTARSFTNASESSTASRGGSGLQVLARLPDVAVPTIELWRAPETSSWHSRLLSPGVRTNLLLGAGVVILLAAVLPFVSGRNKPSPSILPPQDLFTATSPNEASKSLAEPVPAGNVATGNVAAVPNNQGSSVADLARTNANRTEPANKVTPTPSYEPKDQVPPQPSPWPNTSATAQYSQERNTAPVDSARVLPPPRNPTDRSAFNDRYPSVGSVNRPMSLGNPPAPPSAGYPAEGLADRQMSPPPSTAGNPFEPGTARLEGTIEKPSVRTTYDRPRPGIY